MTPVKKGRITILEVSKDIPFNFLHLPGVHLKFSIQYDELNKWYILVSNVADNSALNIDFLPKDWIGDATQRRSELGVYVSSNLIDWRKLTRIKIEGGNYKEARSYPSLFISNDDLYIASRSSNLKSANSHDTNIITLYSINNYREYVD